MNLERHIQCDTLEVQDILIIKSVVSFLMFLESVLIVCSTIWILHEMVLWRLQLILLLMVRTLPGLHRASSFHGCIFLGWNFLGEIFYVTQETTAGNTSNTISMKALSSYHQAHVPTLGNIT